MTYTTSAQFPKKAIFNEMNPIPPLKMGSITYWHNKGASGNLEEPGPKNLSKTYMKVESKETNWHWKLKRGMQVQSK